MIGPTVDSSRPALLRYTWSTTGHTPSRPFPTIHLSKSIVRSLEWYAGQTPNVRRPSDPLHRVQPAGATRVSHSQSLPLTSLFGRRGRGIISLVGTLSIRFSRRFFTTFVRHE